MEAEGTIKEKNIIFSNFIAELEIEIGDNFNNLLHNDKAKTVFKAIKSPIKSGKPSEKLAFFQSDSEKKANVI